MTWRSWPVVPELVPPDLRWRCEPQGRDYLVGLAFATDKHGHTFRRFTFPDGSSVYSGLEYHHETTSATERTSRRFLDILRG